MAMRASVLPSVDHQIVCVLCYFMFFICFSFSRTFIQFVIGCWDWTDYLIWQVLSHVPFKASTPLHLPHIMLQPFTNDLYASTCKPNAYNDHNRHHHPTTSTVTTVMTRLQDHAPSVDNNQCYHRDDSSDDPGQQMQSGQQTRTAVSRQLQEGFWVGGHVVLSSSHCICCI